MRPLDHLGEFDQGRPERLHAVVNESKLVTIVGLPNLMRDGVPKNLGIGQIEIQTERSH